MAVKRSGNTNYLRIQFLGARKISGGLKPVSARRVDLGGGDAFNIAFSEIELRDLTFVDVKSNYFDSNFRKA